MAQLLEEYNLTSESINKISNKIELENNITTYTNLTLEACNNSIPKIKTKNNNNLPWWSEELATQKREVRTRKRRIRCAAPVRRAKVIGEYLEIKEKYEQNAKKAQIESWKEFCGKQEKEGMWEGIYRVIGRATKRQEDLPLIRDGKSLDPKESAELLARTFYPEDNTLEDNGDHRETRKLADQVNGPDHVGIHDPPFTLEEIKIAVSSFNPKKAPGSDGLTADICKQAILQDPETFLSIANKCLEQGHFPKAWKEATVVVLRKPGKANYQDPKSYRPIGLLPVMGKIFEKVVMGRIRYYVLPKLSTRQFGFVPQKSTEDALYALISRIRQKLELKKLITVVSLDIEGAFDGAWWPALRVRLAEEGCPLNIRRVVDSYLEGRTVKVRYAGEEIVRQTSKGCVQGSIGGPLLWNLLIDPLLKGLEERGNYGQAFADDVVLIVDGDTALDVQRQANAALAYVREWGIKNKLKFAPHKTNAMIVTNKLKYDTPLLRMGGIGIEMSKEIKILGLTIDSKLTFNQHTTNICKKALNIYKQLSRAAKISWGLHPEVIRMIYTAVVEPTILYAASVWAPATKKIGTQKVLNAVQRGFAQKLCRAYKTVSLNSALTLSGILPLDLRVQEAAALYKARRGVPQAALGDTEVETMSANTDKPHPAKYMDLEFYCLEDQQQVDIHSDYAVRMFTDGSKIEGKVGAALSIWDNEVETKTLKLKLSSYCTVYQAELLAIYQATEEILKSSETRFGVYSDSRSSLQAVTNNSSTHPLALKIRKNLKASKDQNKCVDLFWIKAHAGLEGNERADALAKDAALKTKTKPVYDACPVSFVKRQIRKGTLDEWNRRYTSSEKAAVTKLFFPDAIKAHKIINKVKPSGILTQILTGHGGFSEYLNRFRCKDNPSCICEPEKQETVVHVLFECPVFGRERFEAENRLNIDIKIENISKYMSNKLIRNDFIEYCVQIASKVINRNKDI